MKYHWPSGQPCYACAVKGRERERASDPLHSGSELPNQKLTTTRRANTHIWRPLGRCQLTSGGHGRARARKTCIDEHPTHILWSRLNLNTKQIINELCALTHTTVSVSVVGPERHVWCVCFYSLYFVVVVVVVVGRCPLALVTAFARLVGESTFIYDLAGRHQNTPLDRDVGGRRGCPAKRDCHLLQAQSFWNTGSWAV